MRATLSSESSRHEARRENMVEVLKKLSCGNHGFSAPCIHARASHRAYTWMISVSSTMSR